MSRIDYMLTTKRQKVMDKYILQKDIPLVKAGTIFVHDKEDSVRGSLMEGCLKLAWTDDGNCQGSLCADTIVFHASAKDDPQWFKKKEDSKVEVEMKKFKEKVIHKLEEIIECLKSE